VAGVQFKLDGGNLGGEDTAPPYLVNVDTNGAPNGVHTVLAIARDAAGNVATSSISVNVNNVTASTDPNWPNEPGLVPISDWFFDSAPSPSGDVPIGASGWNVVANAAVGSPRGWATLTSDPSAPGGSTVFDFVYPQGMVEGNAPATVYHNVRGDQMYVGFWWKPSAPFDYGPNGNKVAFMFNGGGGAGGQSFLILNTSGTLSVLPEYPGSTTWRMPNVSATPVSLGQWHRVEWYANRLTGALKWWLDGVLQGSYNDAPNPYPFDMFQFSPTWGGNVGARKAQTDHYWFGHVHLTVR